MSTRKRARLFREVNNRIYDLLESAEPDLPGEFLCECGRDCEQRISLLPAAFAALRKTGRAIESPGCRDGALGLRAEPVPGGIAVPG